MKYLVRGRTGFDGAANAARASGAERAIQLHPFNREVSDSCVGVPPQGGARGWLEAARADGRVSGHAPTVARRRGNPNRAMQHRRPRASQNRAVVEGDGQPSPLVAGTLSRNARNPLAVSTSLGPGFDSPRLHSA